MFVNGVIGASTQQLSSFAQAMSADGTGEIVVSVTRGASGDAGVAGIAIRPIAAAVSGDFNGDESWDCHDIDSLVAAIAAGSNDAAFDLTGDQIVDLQDRDAWLEEAGSINLGPGSGYLLGDATLDGFVDGQDFIAWNANKFTEDAGWCNGDFNADGFTDGQDFVEWNAHKFTMSGGAPIGHHTELDSASEQDGSAGDLAFSLESKTLRSAAPIAATQFEFRRDLRPAAATDYRSDRMVAAKSADSLEAGVSTHALDSLFANWSL